MKKTILFFALPLLLLGCADKESDRDEVLDIIERVNTYWQVNNAPEVRPVWDNAAYHTGNMEVYFP